MTSAASRKLALVTGASAGIGTAFAEELARRGHDVALVARREPRLQDLAQRLEREHGVQTYVLPADLAQPGACASVLSRLAEQDRHVDVLVNNAGYVLPKRYVQTEWTDQEANIAVLVTAVAELSHRVLPGMLERNYGRIINVASFAGLLPGMPGGTLYGAAKSFVVTFSESLAAEVAGTDVSVCASCPGYTHSEFHDVSGTRKGVSKLPGFMWHEPSDVVTRALGGVERRQAVVVFGVAYRIIAALAHWFPRGLFHGLVVRFSGRYRRKRA